MIEEENTRKETNESSDDVEKMKRQLEELMEILLHNDENDKIADNKKKKIERSERLKCNLIEMIINIKKFVFEEKTKNEKNEKKIEILETNLNEEKTIADKIRKENERLIDRVNYMKRKLKSCEMEGTDLLKNMETLRLNAEQERENKRLQEHRVVQELKGLQYYKREMIRSRIIIEYGAKGMALLKRNLEYCARKLQEQKSENEELKKELAKYKKNYTNRSMNYDLMMQDLQNLEKFLELRKRSCFRKTHRTKLEMNIIRRVKELLTEGYCRFLIV